MRNVLQIFGEDLTTPVDMVICWTVDGKRQGGTGQALRIAADHKIPIFDLAICDPNELIKFVQVKEKF